MDEHSGLNSKGNLAAVELPDAERERVLSVIAQRVPSTVADVEGATGVKLMPKILRSLSDNIAILATHPCVERPDKRAHICLTPKECWKEGVRSDALLVSLLKIKRADKTHLFSRAELQKALPRSYGGVFKAEFDLRQRERRWPVGVAALAKAGKLYVFAVEDMQGNAQQSCALDAGLRQGRTDADDAVQLLPPAAAEAPTTAALEHPSGFAEPLPPSAMAASLSCNSDAVADRRG